MNKVRVLFLTNQIPAYRKPLYEGLGKKFDLTIAHFGSSNSSDFYVEKLVNVDKIKAVVSIKEKIKYANYDVVIVWGGLKFFELYKIIFKKNKKFKIILFGPGVSSSYSKKYDSDWKVSFIYKLILNRVDAAIFYDNYPVIKYCGKNIEPNKLFAAPNTLSLEIPFRFKTKKDRNTIIFIGTLYKEKGVLDLLKAYKLLLKDSKDLPMLEIIGDGPQENFLSDWVKENELTEIINFRGRITEESILKNYFQKALACISPKQAGLSVIKSLAYGVPFITSKYPITGGEYTAIIEGATGFYYDGTIENLKEVIQNKIIDNENLDDNFISCREYYKRFRSPEIWLDQFSSAINYTLK